MVSKMKKKGKTSIVFISVFIICLTVLSPLISSHLIANGFGNSKNLTTNENLNQSLETDSTSLKKAPSIDDFFTKYDNDGYISPEKYLPNTVPDELNLTQNSEDPLEDLGVNIDLSKTAYTVGETVEFTIQVMSGLNPASNADFRLQITTGDCYYYWFYNDIPYSTLVNKVITTNENGFYQDSFVPPAEGSYTILVTEIGAGYARGRRLVTVSDLMIFWRIPYDAVLNATTTSYALILDSTNFSPISNVNVTLTAEYWDYSLYNPYSAFTETVFTGLTDENGLITIDYTLYDDSLPYVYLILSAEKDSSKTSLMHYVSFKNHYWYYYYETEPLYEKYSFITTADKPIYQPGDKINTRTIVFQEDYWKVTRTPAVSTEIEVEFKNLQDFTLYHEMVITDENGIFEWTYQFDRDVPIGLYSLFFKKEGSTEVFTFELDNYEKPDFKVEISLESEYVPPKKEIKGTINAEYYFGKPVPGEVVISFYYSDIFLDSITGTLDSDGNFEFEWKIPSSVTSESKKPETIIIKTQVMDVINRVVNSEREVTCESDIRAYIWKYPYGIVSEGEKIKAYYTAYHRSLRTTYFSWDPVQNANAKIVVYGVGFLGIKFKLFTLSGKTDDYGRGSVEFIIPESYFPKYRMFMLDLTIQTDDGRKGESSTAFSVALIEAKIDISPENNILPGSEVDITLSFVNKYTGKNEDGLVFVYVMDAEYDTICYIDDFHVNGPETFTIHLSEFAPSGKYRISTYFRYDKLKGFLFPRYTCGNTEFTVGTDYSLTIEADKESYSSSDTIILTGHLSHTGNAPTIIEFAKRGIVDIILIDSTETDFTITLTDIEDLAPLLTIFAYAITPTGMILETIAIIEIKKELNVNIESDKSIYEPGKTATITISLTNEDGDPIDGLGALSLIDSSIFAVQEDTLVEESFYEEEKYWSEISTKTSWTALMSNWWYWWYDDYFPLYYGGYYEMVAEDVRGEGTFSENTPSEIEFQGEIRDNLPESANWLPEIIFSNGKAEITIELPDNIGEWTVRLFVTSTDQGVVVKETFKTFLPFFVDLKVPQGVIQDDVIVVRGIAYNYLNDTSKVSVTISTDGLTVINNPTQTVIVPQDYLVEIRWTIYCNDYGIHNITLTGIAPIDTNTWFDGIKRPIHIEPNGVPFVKTVSGILNDTLEIDYELYENSIYSNIDLVISPGIMETAISSWERLIGYPYGCMEQTMSKLLPDIMIYDYLENSGLLTLSAERTINSMLQVGLSRVASFQHVDGGWGWWYDDDSQVYMTAYILYGLGLMKDFGLQLSPSNLNAGINYLISKQSYSTGAFTTDTWRLDQLSFTAYVIRTLITLNVTETYHIESLNKAINYFINSWTSGSTLKNPYAAALFIEATINTPYENTSFLSDLKDYILSEAIIEENGLRWELNSDNYWNALGGTIETTATVIVALAKMDFLGYYAIIRQAIEWLIEQQSDYGWGNTADTSAAIKAIVIVGYNPAEILDCIVEISVNEWSTLINYNESESQFLDTRYYTLEDYYIPGNNTLEINQTGSGQIFYYFTATQILRNDPTISIDTPIYATPGEIFTIDIELQSDSTSVYPANIEITSNEDELILVNEQTQTLQLVNGNEIISFAFRAPTEIGEYSVGGFTLTYTFVDSSLTIFAPSTAIRKLGEVTVIIEEGTTKGTIKTNSYFLSQKEKFLSISSPYDITLDRDYSKLNNIIKGETIEVSILIDNQWESKEFVMLEDYIPAGFIVEEGSINTGIDIIDYTLSSGKITFFISELDIGITEFTYRIIAYDVGSSIASPALLSSMYDSWTIQSAPANIGSLIVKIDSKTGQIKTDFELPTLVSSEFEIVKEKKYYDVSLSILATDNDDVTNVYILFTDKLGNWFSKEATLIQIFENGTEEYSVDLGEFSGQEISYIIAIEDASGNVHHSEIGSIIIPAVIAFVFIIVLVLTSAVFATASSITTYWVKPKPTTDGIIDSDIETVFKETEEDLEAYKHLEKK